MGRKLRAGQMLYGCEVGGAMVPSEEGDFLTELEREVLRSVEVDDLQSPFADGMNILLRVARRKSARFWFRSHPEPGTKGSTA